MMRRHLDIESLRALVGIVDLGGFSAAAQQLGRTQSAVSLQLKRLEETLGQTLVQRSQGRVDGVTAEGAAMLAYARQILRLNDEACAAVGRDEAIGSLRVGLPEELMESVFPAAMVAFRAVYPRLRLNVLAETSAVLRQALVAGQIDLALVKTCGDGPAAEGEVLWQEPLVWMAGDAFRDSLDPALGQALPLALFGENCAFRLAATGALAAAGLPWVLQYTGSSVTGLRHAIAHGLGVTALPHSLLTPGIGRVTHFGAQCLPALPAARLIALHGSAEGSVPARRFATWIGEAMAARNVQGEALG